MEHSKKMDDSDESNDKDLNKLIKDKLSILKTKKCKNSNINDNKEKKIKLN